MKALVRIFVPTESKNANVNRKQFLMGVTLTQEFLCSEFGGCTVIEGCGSWVDDDNKMVQEQVHIVESYALEFVDNHRLAITLHCEQLSKYLAQDCVLFSVEEMNTIRFCS